MIISEADATLVTSDGSGGRGSTGEECQGVTDICPGDVPSG